MQKPKKPIEPKWENFPEPKEPNGVNCFNQPIYTKLDWIKAMKNYKRDLEIYYLDLEKYEQIKLIRLVKNSTEKYCLAKLKITRK